MEPLVRPVRLPEDADQVAALYHEVVAWHADRWPLDYLPAGDEPSLPDGLEPLPDNSCLLVAELPGTEDQPGRLVGLVSGSVHQRPSGWMFRFEGPVLHVGDLVVTADWRRQGIGSESMRELERWAIGHDATTVVLNVDDRNQNARAMYEESGFRRVNVMMRKELEP